MMPVLLVGAITSLVISIVAAAIIIPLLRRMGLVDIPTARSSHSAPVARGGGFAVGCGVTAGTVAIVIAAAFTDQFSLLSAVFIGGAFVIFTWCFSILGFMDDMGSMPSGGRLILQVLIAAAFVLGLSLFQSGGPFGLVAVALGIVFIVNGVNFMDGLNALTSSWAAVVGVWYCIIFLTVREPVAAALAAAFAAAAAGFLPFNVGKARAFLGDVGSYGIGAAVAAFVALLLFSGASPLVVGAPLLLLVFDVGWTLLTRLYERENVFQAHRRHIYQLTQQNGLTHLQTSGAYALLNFVACLATIPVLLSDARVFQWGSALVLACVAGIYSQLPVLARAVGKPKDGAVAA